MLWTRHENVFKESYIRSPFHPFSCHEFFPEILSLFSAPLQLRGLTLVLLSSVVSIKGSRQRPPCWLYVLRHALSPVFLLSRSSCNNTTHSLSQNNFIVISPLRDIFFCLMHSFLSIGTYHFIGIWPPFLKMKSHCWSFCLLYFGAVFPLLSFKIFTLAYQWIGHGLDVSSFIVNTRWL